MHFAEEAATLVVPEFFVAVSFPLPVMTTSASDSALSQFIGQTVVLDVASMYVYVGTLAEVDEKYLVLTDADVHDLRDTTTTREVYVIDTKRHGVSVNRRRVLVNRAEIVSLSDLNDVVE